VGHVEECNFQGFRRAGLHDMIYPGQQIDSANKKCQIWNSCFWLDIFTWLRPQPPLPKPSKMRSFLKEGGNDMFAQGNKLTFMKINRNIEKRGPLGKTLPQKYNYFAHHFSTTLPSPYQYILL
jgi:hypothetical protein